MRKYKLRFNLGRGKNYMKWKITEPNGNYYYLDPQEHQLKLYNCFLKNRKNAALKIYNGAHKTVCAWVEAENIEILNKPIKTSNNIISFNPRIEPNWVIGGEDADGRIIDIIVTNNTKLYY